MLRAARFAVPLYLCTVPPVTAQTLTTVRFSVASQAAVDSVRRLGIDIVETHPRADRGVDLVAVVSQRDLGLVASRGWAVADVPRPAAALGASAFTVYRDFDDPVRGVAAYLQAFAAARTNVRVDSIGASVQGRPILAVKIGAPDDNTFRPNVVYLATYHAREWAATEMALRLVRYLADSLNLTINGNLLLSERDVWVIPVVNPDGYQHTFSTDRLWRKNRRPNADGTFGVDLNRNHAGFWGFDDTGSSPNTAAEIYRGPSASSEPETSAIEAFHRAHPPAASISYHTYTGAVLYPWSHVDGVRTGDDGMFRALAGTDLAPAIADSLPGSVNTYYHPGPGWQLYTVNGDYTSYAYRAFRTAAFTVELTSGCCVGGNYYGFNFPDNEAMLARMAADNMPFALTLLREAANLSSGNVVPAAAGTTPQFESVWPEVQALLNQSGASISPMDIAVDSAVSTLVILSRDSMGQGRRFARKLSSDPLLLDARAVRLPIDGLKAEILLRDGAENPMTPWRGFHRASVAHEGQSAWFGFRDTLVSPSIDVAGRGSLAVFFWTRHGGSVFQQSARGRVEVSVNGGSSWTTVAQLVGAAPLWYPVNVSLATVPPASTLRVRFIAENMDWGIDAVSVTSSDAQVTRLFAPGSPSRAQQVEVSANPVRAAPVVLRWPAGGGSARVDVFTLTGTRVAGVSLGADPGRWSWDLTTEAGQPIANGAYFVVVTLGDGSRIRRRIIVAR